MDRWDTIGKWIITRVATDERIMTYEGSFIDVMRFVNRNYEDGAVDVESYENWISRKESING